ncbi:MAG: Rho termination factor N-terminal domain-containing protein, partial [Acidimicrobiales bacterium]
MSVSPQSPLERSVLERKERDELATIAEAMGVKASSRASKSTLIDHILREAGIETAPEEKPKRTRVSRAAAAAAAA